MKSNSLILIGAGVLAIILLKKQTAAASINPTGAPISTGLTTAQMQQSIMSWWMTATPPNQQASDNGQFEDVINNLDAGTITNIYTYITQYVLQNTRPPAGSALALDIQNIQTQYGIL